MFGFRNRIEIECGQVRNLRIIPRGEVVASAVAIPETAAKENAVIRKLQTFSLFSSCLLMVSVAAVSHAQINSNASHSTAYQTLARIHAEDSAVGIVHVRPLAGTDIGAQLNTCIATFSPTNPGICDITTGTYALTTQVIKPQWVTIEGNNAVITVSSLSGPPIICASTTTLLPTYPGSYSRRGIRNLTLMGSGPASTPYGIWLGGDPAGKIISSSATDFLEQFDNVQVQDFGSQYTMGTNVYQEFWVGGTIMGGYDAAENGFTIATGATGAENLTFTGTQFVAGGGNTGHAINVPNAYGSTINLDHVSIDYWGSNNSGGCPGSLGTGQVVFNGGHLTANASHFETCSGPQIVATSTATMVAISIDGGTEFTITDSTHALTALGVIEVAGGFSQVNVEAGTLVSIAGSQSIDAYVYNSGTGGQIWLGPYLSSRGGYYEVPPIHGSWNSGLVPIMTNGSLYGFNVIGNLSISGSITKGSGSFKIDHPLDPANKYLSHSFVESPDMMDVYNGNATTDNIGLAVVVLPSYFEGLNRDFRYQLTPIGQFAEVTVAKEIRDNRFTIRSSKPRVKVSWQVTGIRHDAYANAHRIPTEEMKSPGEQGYYLHPELFGTAKEQAVGGGSGQPFSWTSGSSPTMK
jgi:hypothetical protein